MINIGTKWYDFSALMVVLMNICTVQQPISILVCIYLLENLYLETEKIFSGKLYVIHLDLLPKIKFQKICIS